MSSSFFIRKRRGGAGGGTTTLPTNLSSRSSDASKQFNNNATKKQRFQQQQQRGAKRKRGNGSRTVPTKPRKQDNDDEEITSESDEEEEQDNENLKSGDEHNNESNVSSAAEEEETEQEARLRIAKEQISALRNKLLEKNVDVSDHDIAGLIKQNELIEEGRVLRKVVTEKFKVKELVSTMLLYGNVVKSPLTCIRSTTTHVYASTKSGAVICVSLSQQQQETNQQKDKHNNSSRTSTKLTPPPVTCLAVSPTTIAASTTTSIHLLTPITLTKTHVFTTAQNTLHLSISSTTLFSTHKDRTVKLWNLTERAYVESLFGHQDIPTCVDALNDNRIVTSGGFDRTLRVWKIDEESQLVFNWDEDIIDVVAVINAGFFVGGSCSGSIGLFSFGRKKPLHVVRDAHGVDEFGVGRWVTSLAGVGDLVASGSDSGVVKVWRVFARKLEFVRDVLVGVGVVVGISVVVNSEDSGGIIRSSADDDDHQVAGDNSDDLKLVVGVGTEFTRGRFGGGRYCNCSRVLLIS